MSAKPKKLNYAIIQPHDDGSLPQPLELMHEIINAHHHHLIDAKIALAWRYGWNEDKDGRLKLGQCRKADDVSRDLHGYDFIIFLNYEAWNKASFTELQMRALIDHELCHAEVDLNEDDEPKVDTAGRTVYRIRGHDVEEFHEIAARYGGWTQGLEQLAKAAVERSKRPLLDTPQNPATDVIGRVMNQAEQFAATGDAGDSDANAALQTLAKCGVTTIKSGGRKAKLG